MGQATSRVRLPDPSDERDVPLELPERPALEESTPQVGHRVVLPFTREMEPQALQFNTVVCPDLSFPPALLLLVVDLFEELRSISSCAIL